MGLREEILALAVYHGGLEIELAGDEDLLGAFAMEGTDADEILEAYAERFGTDLDGLLWYFHYNSDEPPSARPRLYPVSPEGERLPLRPITLDDLIAAAEAGQWTITYPPHEVHERLFWRLLPWLSLVLLPVVLVIVLGSVLRLIRARQRPAVQTSD